MSRFILQIAAMVCLLIFLSGKCLASVRLTVVGTLPPNPDDPYYQRFQTVPPANKTATKLLTNFLSIPGKLSHGRRNGRISFEDIVVVLDGSGSIGSCEFKKGKKALKHMMKLAENTPNVDTKYAAVSYSTNAVVDFTFLPYSTAANDIMQIRYEGGATNT
ncbi:unnamed protein product [Porites evermanni]|uniref:VWFA domain-containing protein n=1 Tax=Porites evermanni TaxID=104178 RepID=A0ABN8RPA0_9CNID|nr:unnamed protein product [Porites evermanni]